MTQAVLLAEPDHQAGQAGSDDAGEFEQRVAPTHSARDEFARKNLGDQRLTGGGEKTAGKAPEDDHAIDDCQLGPAGGQEFGDEEQQAEGQHRREGADGDAAAIIRVGYMAGEKHRADEGNHFGQSDGTESQGCVGAFVLGQTVDLPGDSDVLNLDGEGAQDDRREIKAKRPRSDSGSGCLRGVGHHRNLWMTWKC